VSVTETTPPDGLGAGYWRLFTADAISTIGTVVSTLAIQFLLIDTLKADEQAIGLVRAAQWAPYLLFGLLAGVVAERVRRKPLLVLADLLGMTIFGAIGLLALSGRLTVPALSGLVFVFGAVTCVSVAAYQSYVPRLVPERGLPDAFARLEQMGQVIGSVGPVAAGSLVRFFSAPLAVLVDALSYAVSAVVIATIRTPEPAPQGSEQRHLVTELREGARWVYRHETLRPYALWLHSWFIGRAMVVTVLVFYANQELHLDALTVGLILAAAGVSGVAAAGVAPRLGRRFGIGRVITTVEWVSPLWPVLVVLAQPGPWAVTILVVAQLLDGLTAISASLMMSYRTAVTPDRLRARMNATIRTFNWGGLAVASFVSGWVASIWGSRVAILAGAAILLVATAYLRRSAFRAALLPPAAVSPAD
jgi:MFS family permease